MKEIIKHFNDRLDHIEKKIERLDAFRWQVLGALALGVFIINLVLAYGG